MAKYLVKASYTSGGTKGLLKDGGTDRVAAVRKMVRGMGGKLDSFYYAYGDTDVFAIIDVPDSATALALSLAINSTGMVTVSMTPLITPAEVDAAAKKTVKFGPPGT